MRGERCATSSGWNPSPELRRLEQEILRHDPTLDVGEVPPPQPEPAPTTPSSALAPRTRRRVGGAIVAGVVAACCVLGLAAFVVTRSGSDPRLIEPNSVGVIDPQTGIVVADIAVGIDPASITAASGSVWVGNVADETVSRIDVSSRNLVRTIATGAAPLTLAPASKGVWVGSRVSAGRIDPEFNYVVDRRAIPHPQPVGGTPLTVAEGVWLPAGDGIAHVDPTSAKIDDSVATGTDGPSSIAVGAGAVWVAQPDDKAIVRIGRSRLLTPIRLSASPTAVAVGEGAVWAVTTGDTLIRIDPTAAAVETTIPVGARPTGVTVGGGSVWVANGLEGTISQVDPRRNAVVRTINVGNSPQGVAWVEGELWVPVQARAPQSVERKPSGTLRVEAQLSDFGGFDPALNFTTYGAQFDYATCLQLLNHPDAGAPTGTQLEPEAATSLPAVSRDKRSYTFTIRDGFRFSPPSRQTVTAETFRYSIERSLNPTMKSYAVNIFGDIAGVHPFEAGRARHISGITVRGSRLTIRLAKPSPDFLERVSTPFFCAVPIGTPINPRGVHEIPAAGPYYVASERATQVVLKRNPNYGGSRPRWLDRIVLTLGRSQEKMAADIRSGRADYALDGIPRSMVAPIAARYGPGSRAAAAGRQRYFQVTQPTVEYLVLNTQRPLFSHLRLRRAVNYAVDRATLASLGGPSSDPSVNGPQIPTDHFLPPGIRGYQDARTYPLRPDIRTAKRLAHGLRGTAIMYSCDLDTCDEVAQTVSANLKPLGINVIIKRWPIGEMYARERAPREPFDLGLAGWSADYADGGAFLSALFEGSSIAKGSNTSRFAEAAVGQAIRRSGPSDRSGPRTRVRRTRPRACQGRSPRRCSRLPDARRLLLGASRLPDRTARRVRHRSRSSLHSQITVSLAPLAPRQSVNGFLTARLHTQRMPCARPRVGDGPSG